MLNFKEGQTYICTKSNESWWTEVKEYTVTLDRYGTPLLPDNDGYKWSSHSLNASSHQFKLKEENKMLNFKEGQTYICTKAERPWWTEGKEYTVVLNSDGIPALVDNGYAKWPANALSAFNNEFKLKENTTMNTLDIKEGQTYVCKRDDLEEWTLGKEYNVQTFSNGVLYLTDDEGYNWYIPNDGLLNDVFKLKENTFDLNKLTTAQLREYVDLLEDKEESESLLNYFIERMSK